MTDDTPNINSTITSPANLPSGTKLKYKLVNGSVTHTVDLTAGEIKTVDFQHLYKHEFTLVLPSGWTFVKWTFTGWSINTGYSDTDNPTRATMTGSGDDPHDITFEVKKDEGFDWKINIVPKPNGNKIYVTYRSEPTQVITQATDVTHKEGGATTFRAEPIAGYVFKNWTTVSQGGGGRTHTDNPLYLGWGEPEACFVVQANFEEDTSTADVTLHLDSSATGAVVQYKVGSGSWTNITDGSSVNVTKGSSMTFRVRTYPSGKTLDHWVIRGESYTSETPTFNVSEDTDVTLYLKSSVQTYALDIKFDSTARGHAHIKYTVAGQTHDISTDLPQPENIEKNKMVSFTVSNISSQYMFKRWNVENTDTGKSTDKKNQTFTQLMTYNTLVTLYLARKYRITVNQSIGGTISPGSKDVEEGSDVTFDISPDSHYKISDVIVDGVSQGAVTSYTFYNVTAEHTITAVFVERPKCQVRVTSGSGGRIDPSGVVYIYEGESQIFSIIPDSGFIISDVIYDGRSQGAISSITIPYAISGHTLTATFKQDARKYKITTQSIGQGTVVSSASEVVEGGSVSITSTPDSDWFLKNITDNGVSKGAVNPYIINNIKENHTVVAEFERTPYVRTLIYIKESGAWKVINLERYPQIYLKKNGIWFKLYTDEDAPMIYQKVGNTWVPLFEEVNTDLI